VIAHQATQPVLNWVTKISSG